MWIKLENFEIKFKSHKNLNKFGNKDNTKISYFFEINFINYN